MSSFNVEEANHKAEGTQQHQQQPPSSPSSRNVVLVFNSNFPPGNDDAEYTAGVDGMVLSLPFTQDASKKYVAENDEFIHG
jgi:hypothetical protein